MDAESRPGVASPAPGAAPQPAQASMAANGAAGGAALGVLGLLMLASFTQQFHRYALPAVGERIMSRYGISPEAMGSLYSAFFYSYTLFMTPGGWLADRLGAWWTLLCVLLGSAAYALLTGALGLLGLGATAAFLSLGAARLAFGVLSAPLYPSTSRTAGRAFTGKSQPLANALVTAAAPLGMAFVMKALPALAGSSLGWELAFVACGLATLPVAILWGFAGRSQATRASQRAREEAPRAGLATLFRHRGLLFLTVAYGLLGYFEYLLFNWTKYYYQEVLQLEESRSATYTMWQNVTMMVFAPIGGWLSCLAVLRYGQRTGLRAVPMAGMAVAGLFLVLGAFTGSLLPKVIELCLALGFIGACEGPFWAAAVRLGGRYGGTAAGFMNTGGNLLGSFAPTATPIIAGLVNRALGHEKADPLGWTAALVAGSIAAWLGVIFWLGVDVEKPLEA